MRSSRIPFVLLLGLGLVGLSSFLVSQTQEAGDLLDQNQAGVVAIVIYGADKQEIAKGTGFAVAEDVIATAYHVIGRAVEAEALTFKGKKMKVEGFLAVNKPLDIALIKIKGKVQPLSLGNSDELAAGGRVFAIGSNETGAIGISEGTIRR
ncbi:MAG TPA: serine protease, partial [Candidatus Aminicenantes bacterium]|nr:serine protease [Candidatus Aminicenantes bacterium]